MCFFYIASVKRVITILLLFCCTQVVGQESESLVGRIILVDSNESESCRETFAQKDTLEFLSCVSQHIKNLQFQGYLEARIDSIIIDSIQFSAFATKGQKYQWATVKTDSITDSWLKKARVKTEKFVHNPVRPDALQTPIQNILRFFENNGHPFARVSLDGSKLHNSKISVNLKINPGPLILIDTLYVKGDANISQTFIQQYLNLNKGDFYSQNQINRIDDRLRQLPYLSVIRQSEVEFIPGKARIYSYITNKKASQFSGLVGFASGQDNSQGILLTGDVNLRLANVFKMGELNTLQWQALGEGTQRLNISSKWDYIRGINAGFKANFALYRLDTTFINVNPKTTVNFYLNSGSSLGLGIDYRASSTLKSQQSSTLSNYKTTLYQINYSLGQSEPDYFPVRNLFVDFTVGVGSRETDNNTQEEGSRTTVGEIQVISSGYHPIVSQSVVFHVAIQAQMLEPISSRSDDFVYMDNELYRIGGANSLRGFNQEAILTNAYSIGTIELQYRLQRILNFFAFFDKAFVATTKNDVGNVSWPQGAGLGFQLASAGGILNFSYALGSGMGQSFSLREAKVHVGYIANF